MADENNSKKVESKAAFWIGYLLMVVGLIYVSHCMPEHYRSAVKGCLYGCVTFVIIVIAAVAVYSIYIQQVLEDMGL